MSIIDAFLADESAIYLRKETSTAFPVTGLPSVALGKRNLRALIYALVDGVDKFLDGEPLRKGIVCVFPLPGNDFEEVTLLLDGRFRGRVFQFGR